MMLRTHTQTGGSTLTAQQPENNIVRAAIQALAAALGGVQSMALSCYDEALAIPTEKAQKIAVRTQQIIAEEIGVTDTIDPMAGSYYLEWLTDELERRAVEEMERIEKMGGAVEAIESGYYHKAILDEAYKWEQDGQRRASASWSASTSTATTRSPSPSTSGSTRRSPRSSARSSSGCATSATRPRPRRRSRGCAPRPRATRT